jgi:hypothetical protein
VYHITAGWCVKQKLQSFAESRSKTPFSGEKCLGQLGFVGP